MPPIPPFPAPPAPDPTDPRPWWKRYLAVYLPWAATLAMSFILTWLAARPAKVERVEVPVPPTFLGELDRPYIGVATGEKRPTFGWVKDADVIAANLDPIITQQFANTPAGRAAMGDEDVYLWRAVRKAAGKGDDWYCNIDQRDVGCCVGAGWKHGADVCQAGQILSGAVFEFRPCSAEVIYGGSRVEVGKGQIRGDGSVGAWAANWCKNYGIVAMEKYDSADLTEFSPTRARQFGKTGVPADIEAAARLHPIRNTALVKSWQEVKKAIQQYFPVVVCSDQGFTMERDANGVCKPRGSWAHCMVIIAVRTLPDGRVQFFILNSWGNTAHSGPVSPPDAPPAGFWTDAAVIDDMVKQGDSFALSEAVGFPARRIPVNWFVTNLPNVSPAFAGTNSPNRLGGDSIFRGEFFCGGSPVGFFESNLNNVRLTQFGTAVSFSGVFSSMPPLVGVVLRPGSPSKVADPVIRFVPVAVATVHLGWPRSDECEHDDLVYRNQNFAVIVQPGPALGEGHEEITARGSPRNESSPIRILAAPSERPLTPNRAVVAYAVLGEIRDLFVNDRRLSIRHDRLLEWGGCV